MLAESRVLNGESWFAGPEISPSPLSEFRRTRLPEAHRKYGLHKEIADTPCLRLAEVFGDEPEYSQMKFSGDPDLGKAVVSPRNASNKAPKADGVFSNAPYWNFNDDKLKFDTNPVDNANPNYGSASAFLPVCRFSQKRTLAGVLFMSIVSIPQAFVLFPAPVLAGANAAFR